MFSWILTLLGAFVVVMYGAPLLGYSVAVSGALIIALFVAGMFFLFSVLRRRRSRA